MANTAQVFGKRIWGVLREDDRLLIVDRLSAVTQDRVSMRSIARKSLAAFFFTTLPCTAAAQEPAQAPSVQDGMHFAYRWCYACHLDSQRGAPSFEHLARERDITVEYLKRYAANPGHKMLKFDLTDRDAANLQAYIASLAPPAQ